MKKIFILILIIGIGTALYVTNQGESQDTTLPDSSGSTSFQPDPSTATFIFDEEAITLSKGKSESTDALGLVTETELLDERGYGDLNKDGKEDVVVFIAQSGGGSGTFVYVAAYVSGPVGYKGTDAIFLGDRIAPQAISITNGLVTARFLDRKEDEPFSAEPSINRSIQFVYQNGEFRPAQ